MIELHDDVLVFTFPELHSEADFRVNFQRTLRIPDDDSKYPLPPGLGAFPLRHVDDHADRVPAMWRRRGGVMFPMFQSEAMWINFDGEYPMAVKVAAGKINAVTGDTWSEGLHDRPQDYVTTPEQPWLDGYCVEKGVIRQFVAMPLGSGYSAEEQITGAAEHGGLQISVTPMKAEVWNRMRRRVRSSRMGGPMLAQLCFDDAAPDMGLAPGGRMTQHIYDDRFGLDVWDPRWSSRCFVHITNSMVWEAITGSVPPNPPPTAAAYERAGLPWFDYYSDAPAVGGTKKLSDLLSVKAMGEKKGESPLPENESVSPAKVVELRRRLKKDQVREGVF